MPIYRTQSKWCHFANFPVILDVWKEIWLSFRCQKCLSETLHGFRESSIAWNRYEHLVVHVKLSNSSRLFYRTFTDLPTNFSIFTDKKFFTEPFIELGPSRPPSIPNIQFGIGFVLGSHHTLKMGCEGLWNFVDFLFHSAWLWESNRNSNSKFTDLHISVSPAC